MLGAVPASARSLRPASRAINDFNAARINAALSVKPLYSSAVRNRSSSGDTVALIFPLCTSLSTYTCIKVVSVQQNCRVPEILSFSSRRYCPSHAQVSYDIQRRDKPLVLQLDVFQSPYREENALCTQSNICTSLPRTEINWLASCVPSLLLLCWHYDFRNVT